MMVVGYATKCQGMGASGLRPAIATKVNSRTTGSSTIKGTGCLLTEHTLSFKFDLALNSIALFSGEMGKKKKEKKLATDKRAQASHSSENTADSLWFPQTFTRLLFCAQHSRTEYNDEFLINQIRQPKKNFKH
mmetsp:Transcript_20796/g.41193  ORF Transcript_20796/g.41193 Transcript_20796/m.41193 type:complete len:133 (-) Transcript_20796:35-433(-)